MTLCFLGLGSNLKCPERQLRNALSHLRQCSTIRVLAVADFYYSQAWGRKTMPNFCNTVMAIETRLSPKALISLCQKIEKKQGRVRGLKNGARTLDIDILLFGHFKINTPQLTIPHPRMQERDFVLLPLKNCEQKLTR